MTRLTPEQIAEIKARHEADYEVIIESGSYYIVSAPQMERDRAALLSHIEADGWHEKACFGAKCLEDMADHEESMVGGSPERAAHYRQSAQSLRNYFVAKQANPAPAPPETKEG